MLFAVALCLFMLLVILMFCFNGLICVAIEFVMLYVGL